MTNRPPREAQNTTPNELPNVTPRVQNLHDTSDIRFVMVEIGKMTTAIEGLQDKVDKLDANDRKIQSGISQIKGGLIVAGIALGFLGWLFSDQISALRTTIVSAPAPTQQAPAQPPAPQPKP